MNLQGINTRNSHGSARIVIIALWRRIIRTNFPKLPSLVKYNSTDEYIVLDKPYTMWFTLIAIFLQFGNPVRVT